MKEQEGKEEQLGEGLCMAQCGNQGSYFPAFIYEKQFTLN